jgi:hypothetical protein
MQDYYEGTAEGGPDYYFPPKYELTIDPFMAARIRELQKIVTEHELLEVTELFDADSLNVLDEDHLPNWIRLIVDDENFHVAWFDGNEGDKEYKTKDYEI